MHKPPGVYFSKSDLGVRGDSGGAYLGVEAYSIIYVKGILSGFHFITFVNTFPKLRCFEGRNYIQIVKELFSTFVFPIGIVFHTFVLPMGTSWISSKGLI